MVLPPKDGRCPECGQTHDPEWMHDLHSAIYWLQFIKKHNRRPRWSDAMAHCPPDVQASLKAKMEELGLEDSSDWIPEDEILGIKKQAKIKEDEGFCKMVK
jgi:hypothetical protein